MAVETVVIKCLHQFIRPLCRVRIPENLRPKGMGDCYECTIDPLNNGHCLGCHPIAVHYFEVAANSIEPPKETYSGTSSNVANV